MVISYLKRHYKLCLIKNELWGPLQIPFCFIVLKIYNKKLINFRAHLQQHCQNCGSSLTDQASDSANTDQVLRHSYSFFYDMTLQSSSRIELFLRRLCTLKFMCC